MDEDWQLLLTFFPEGWEEIATNCGALKGLRKDKSPGGSAPPNLAPSEIMRRIKGRSASKIFESFPDLKKKYWGGDTFGLVVTFM